MPGGRNELVPGEDIRTGHCAQRGRQGISQKPPGAPHPAGLAGKPSHTPGGHSLGCLLDRSVSHLGHFAPVESVSWVLCVGREVPVRPALSPPASGALAAPAFSITSELWGTWHHVDKARHPGGPALTSQSRPGAAGKGRAQKGVRSSPFPPPRTGQAPAGHLQRLSPSPQTPLPGHTPARVLSRLNPAKAFSCIHVPSLNQQEAPLHSEASSEPSGHLCATPHGQGRAGCSVSRPPGGRCL